MKLTIEQATLSHTLTQSAAVVETKNTFPMLANVKLSAEGGTLQTVATDMDIEVTTMAPVDAAVIEDGSLTVNAKMLLDIVKRLPKSSLISLFTDGNFLHIEAGKSKFKLATLPAGDFPVMASDVYENTFTIHASELAPLFERTAFAQSTEETRYYLNGVYLHNDADGNLCGVATDGHRLAKMTIENTSPVSSVIVPKKTVAQLKMLLIDGDVEVSTSATKIKVKNGDYTIVSKVIDGTFPDYTRVIPKGNNNTVRVSAKEFSGASGRVSLVSDDRAKGVKLSFSDGVCGLSVKGPSGDGSEEVDVEYTGDPFEIGFNSKILADALAQAENGDVTLRFGSSMDPVLIEPDDYGGFLAVVMPMRM